MSYLLSNFAEQKEPALTTVYNELVKARTSTENRSALNAALNTYKIIYKAMESVKTEAGNIQLNEGIQYEVAEFNIESAKKFILNTPICSQQVHNFTAIINYACDAIQKHADSQRDDNETFYFMMAGKFLEILIQFLRVQTIVPQNKDIVLRLAEEVTLFMNKASIKR